MSVKVTQDRTTELRKAAKALSGKQLFIGIPAEKGMRSGTEVTNALLGYVHEFGSPINNIPARPVLIPGVLSVREKIVDEMRKGAEDTMAGKKDAMDKAFMRAGLIAVAAIQARITDGEFEPLKESTLAARRRKGFMGTKPLIVTGQFRRSFTYVIRSNNATP